MSCNRRIKQKADKVCIGSLNSRIIIYDRDITASSTSSVSYTETLSGAVTVWAMVRTITGKDIFDGVNVIGTATHEFYIRYRDGITAAKWVEYNSKYYDILSVENLNEENGFLKLNCNIRGEKNKTANLT